MSNRYAYREEIWKNIEGIKLMGGKLFKIGKASLDDDFLSALKKIVDEN